MTPNLARLLRSNFALSLPIALAMPLVVAALPAQAQMSFQGLDLSGGQSPSQPAAAAKKTSKAPKVTPKAPHSDQPAMPGLDLSGSPPPPRAPGMAPTMVLPGFSATGKPIPRQRMDLVAKQLKDGRFPESARAAFEITNEASDPDQAAEAEYLLAKSLYKLKMYHSALRHFSKVLARGTDGKFFRPSLEWVFFISRKTVDEDIVLDEVARYSTVAFPPRYQSEFRYLLARYYLARAEALIAAGQVNEGRSTLKQARQLVEMVPKTTPYFAKARFLAGTAAYQDATASLQAGQTGAPESLGQAFEAFKEVVRVTNPRDPEAFHDWHTRELAFMNLARIHFEARQNRAAIYYYGKVDRGGEQWLEALYEMAWAEYRIGDYERALGNMITLNSPFFQDEYFPESLTVKAIIYYENCRYNEARATIDDFESIYGPVHDELEKITGREQVPEAFYQLLDDIQQKQRQKSSTALLDRILKLALSDKDLKRRNGSIQELEGELDSIAGTAESFRYSDLAKTLLDELKAERQLAISQAGLIARAKLEQERDDLKDLLGKGLRIKFETQEKEKQLLEGRLAGQNSSPEVLKQYRYSVAVSDGDQYWPYEGEYWRDELGTYQYTLTKGCRQQGASPVIGNLPASSPGGGVGQHDR